MIWSPCVPDADNGAAPLALGAAPPRRGSVLFSDQSLVGGHGLVWIGRGNISVL
jgi:hypothetical protein